MSRDFLGNAENFRIVRKLIYKLFLYGNQPNDSLIMKVIDHDNILFGQCEDASTINFVSDGHPNGTP